MSDVLTREDRVSGTWQRLRKHMEKRLAEQRAKNDHPMDEANTALVRGRIAELKALLDLDTERPIID